MNREGYNNETVFFVGPEVEHTPAYSKKTLFVIGQPNANQIELMAREYKTPHVFLGANHSFDVNPIHTEYWDETITKLLDKGFWVTLDYPAHQHEKVLKLLNPGIWQSRIFVPLLGVRIPKIETSSPNLTVKIDDVDFKATNPGVWCLHYHQVTDSNRFTDWQDYATDVIVPPMSGAVPDPQFRIAVEATRHVTQIDLGNAKAPVPGNIVSDDKNDSSLGLDTESTSMLKEDPNEETVSIKTAPIGAENAANAYAESGSLAETTLTADSIKKETTKKAKDKK